MGRAVLVDAGRTTGENEPVRGKLRHLPRRDMVRNDYGGQQRKAFHLRILGKNDPFAIPDCVAAVGSSAGHHTSSRLAQAPLQFCPAEYLQLANDLNRSTVQHLNRLTSE